MIGAALTLELRTLVRSPLRVSVLVLTLVAGVFVIVQGGRDVERWNEAIDAARGEQNESIEEARAFFAAGELGPDDRPWVDLTKPLWQDWYAAIRLVREPSPLAGIAFASPEAGAVAVRINRFADPLVSQGSKIENPELVAVGGLDLVTVLSLLLPLMTLALGVEIGGHERASGILPLVRVQSGSERRWLAARCVAVGLLSAAVGLCLVAIACVAGSAGFGLGVVFAAAVVAYVALWTALLAAVALVARHPSQGAVALGAAWIALCVLVPAIGVERAAGLVADDFGLDLTVEARDDGQALDAMDEDAVFAALFRRFPDLEAQVPAERATGLESARDGMLTLALEERIAHREELARTQADLVRWVSVASPAVAFTRALERLAGRDPETAQAYRRAVATAAAKRRERYIAATWASEALDADDFEAMCAATPVRVESDRGAPAGELATLAGWTVGLVLLGSVLSRRGVRTRPQVGVAGAVPTPAELPSGASRLAR